MLEDMLQRSKALGEQSNYKSFNARVVSQAYPPNSPSWPRSALVMVLSLIVGTLAGLLSAYLIENFNIGFKTSEEIEAATENRVISVIPKVQDKTLETPQGKLKLPEYLMLRPDSLLAERLRGLRNAIFNDDIEDRPLILLVTSTVPDEGKTTTALELATSAQSSGRQTLVIDCDFKAQSVSEYFGAINDIGVVDWLQQDVSLDDVIRKDQKSGVSYIPAGRVGPNASDSLSVKNLSLAADKLKEHYSAIIIDCSPAGLVSDAISLSIIADFILYIVRWKSTPRDAVVRTIKRLPRQKIVGIALTMANLDEAEKFGEITGNYSKDVPHPYFRN
jgi:polysaccharide biosynthesis transport protein